MEHEIYMASLGVGVGVFLAMFYDVMRAWRQNVPHKLWMVGIEDFIFWCVATIVMLFLFENFNRGILRFYIFLGCGTGAVLYCFVLTKIFNFLFFQIFRFLIGVFHFLLVFFRKFEKILILPLKNLWERIKIIRNNI